MVKKLLRSLLWSPGTFWIAPSSSPRKAVWSLSWPTSWKRQILVKSGVTVLTDTSWAWASFITLSRRLSPLLWQYRRWTLLRWDFFDPLPRPPVLIFRLLRIAYSCVLIKALSWLTFLTISRTLLSFFWLWQAISWNAMKENRRG